MYRKELIQHLLKTNGKLDTESWDSLGERFGIKGDTARHIWMRYRKEDGSISKVVDKKDERYIEHISDKEIKTEEDLIAICKIDNSRWQIAKMIQNAWGKPEDQRFQVKVWLEPVSVVSAFKQSFEKFLSAYKPLAAPIRKSVTFDKESSCLVVNKQDAHLNKYDTKGENDIIERFKRIEDKLNRVLIKSSVCNSLEKIIYILGSDQFNSEWTSMTTKGTPQQNILPYHVSFQLICDHEVNILNLLLSYGKSVEVLYVPGNHDEYVGWHMMSWLKTYYRNVDDISIDISTDFSKYVRFNNTALMFNHGDAMKPEKLAQTFPVDFKSEWSLCDYYYIFTGDKHTELSKNIGGIKFYQIPSLSNAKSRWDEKNGYTSVPAELNAFLLSEREGLVCIYKEPLK